MLSETFCHREIFTSIRAAARHVISNTEQSRFFVSRTLRPKIESGGGRGRGRRARFWNARCLSARAISQTSSTRPRLDRLRDFGLANSTDDSSSADTRANKSRVSARFKKCRPLKKIQRLLCLNFRVRRCAKRYSPPCDRRRRRRRAEARYRRASGERSREPR